MGTQRRSLMLATLAVATLLAAAVFIMLVRLWVPTKGKAWLISELERAFPVDVSIRSMRYAPFRGLLLEDVRAVAHASHDAWFAADTMHVAIVWPALLQGRVVFRALAPVEVPCRTNLLLYGYYGLRTKMLTVDLQTSEFTRQDLAGPLAQRVPSPLTEGRVRLKLHIVHRPAQAPALTGRITGSQLVWTTPTWRARGDLTIEGAVTPPAHPTEVWAIQALIAVHSGAVEGLASVGAITQLDATAQLEDDHLEITSLAGTAFGSRWTVEGTVAPIGSPAVELLIHSRAETAPLAGGLVAPKSDWGVAGPAEVRAVCRGPLNPRPFLDCLVRAEPRDMTLTHPKLASPITHVTGRLAYDALTQHLSIESLSARVAAESLTATGEVLLRPPAQLDLAITGRLPLETIIGWLPPDGPITKLGGTADLHLAVQSRVPDLQYTGQVTLRDVNAACTTFPNRVDRLAGTVQLDDDRIELTGFTFRANDQPVTLAATITSLDEPHIAATMQLPRGSLTLVGHMAPTRFTIDDARLALEQSQLHITGSVSRTSTRPSAIDLDGVVELADLAHLPFVPLPALSAWHLQGPATVEAQFRGRFSSWTDAALRGRFQADRLMVREVPVEHLVCDVEQADRILRIHVPSSFVADGKFLGELSLEPHRDGMHYALQADLVQLQLAALTQTIPAWKDRPVRGTASAHAMASGTWQTRSSWRSDGWLNASGEQLGEVPLLDKLFRGLFGVLGDRLGLESLRHAQITQVSVHWQLANERFNTQDLRLGGLAGTEPVAIYGTGSVGLDQTLDFTIEPELSEGTILEAPTTSTLANTVLKAAGRLERLRRLIGRHRLVGTLKNPDYHFELSSKDIFKQVAPADLLQGILDSLR